MKKSIALFATVLAIGVTSVYAQGPGASASTDKKSSESCTAKSGACCKDKKGAACCKDKKGAACCKDHKTASTTTTKTAGDR